MIEPGRWTADVYAHLSRLLLGPPGLACFDWDNTCISGDIGEAVLEQLDADDGGDRSATYDRMCQDVGKREAYAWCAFAVAGRTEEAATAYADRVLQERLKDGRIRRRPEVGDLIAQLHRKGWEVWVVSASEERLVRACAPLYGVPAARVIGMRLAVRDGALAPLLDGPNTYRQGKVDAIDLRIGRRPVFAAGDAETDVEMLSCARHALFLGRRHDALWEQAPERGWWAQDAREW